MKYNKLNRRMFLQGSGSAALAIPFLGSLFSEKAFAASSKPKFIHFHSNFGLDRSTTTPLYYLPYPSYSQPMGAKPDAVAWTQKDADTKYQSLADIIKYAGSISYTFDASWNSMASRMNLVSNSHAYVSQNNHSSSVSGTASLKNDGLHDGDIYGPTKNHAYSTDFLVEEAFQQSSANPISALRVFLADTPGTYRTFCYGTVGGVGKKLPMIGGMAELVAKITAAGGGGNSGGVDQTKITRRQLRIDAVLEDFKSLLNHRRISELDKKRLNEAAELWYAAERGLASVPTMSCNAPGSAPAGSNWTVRQKAGLDAIALALSCGLTRTVAYALLQGGPNMDDQGLMHGWDHDPRGPNSADPKITDRFFSEVTRWRSDMVLYFANKLASMRDETGASLLDSSLIAWTHQYGGLAHNMLGHNLLSIGNAGGRLETGYHIDAGAAPIGRFHLTNMMALGLSLPQIERNGVPGFGEVVQTISTGDGSNAPITGERDDKQNDSSKRRYDNSKLSYYQQTAQRRKTFPYLKG